MEKLSGPLGTSGGPISWLECGAPKSASKLSMQDFIEFSLVVSSDRVLGSQIRLNIYECEASCRYLVMVDTNCIIVTAIIV